MKPLNFRNNTDFLSNKLYDAHYKLYEGYVKKVNEITEDLKKDGDREKANATYSEYRGLKKGETYALSGVVLHELYFQNIGGSKSGPHTRTLRMFEDDFKGFHGFVKDMTACGKAARGWAILAYDQRAKDFRILLLDSHDEGMVAGAYAILVMDMYEHAYTTDYGIDKDKYISNFLNDINWDIVEKRMEKIIVTA